MANYVCKYVYVDQHTSVKWTYVKMTYIFLQLLLYLLLLLLHVVVILHFLTTSSFNKNLIHSICENMYVCVYVCWMAP